MANSKDVKISFHTLFQRMNQVTENDPIIEEPFFLVREILNYVNKLPKKQKFMDLQNDKFCFLETMTNQVLNDKEIISGFFKSARNAFRPNLINKRTGSERPNPKEISEGDIEKTHFLIRLDVANKEVYMFLEHNFHGLNYKNVTNYIKKFCKLYIASKGIKNNFTIHCTLIPRNDFLTELEKLARTKLAEIYFDKQLLGGNALNFSNKTVSLKRELKLIATASTKESITEFAVDCYNGMKGQNSKITKVRITGTDENSNDIVLDSSFMNRVEFTTVDINDQTGELNTTQILTGLKRIAKSF